MSSCGDKLESVQRFLVLAPCGMFVLCEIIINENACGLHLLCILSVMGWGTFHCALVLCMQNCPDLTVPPTDLRGRWESGPEQVGRLGEEDEGHLADHAQEDGQEAHQVLQWRDGESVHFLGFLEGLLFWRALSHTPHPNHILRAEAVYDLNDRLRSEPHWCFRWRPDKFFAELQHFHHLPELSVLVDASSFILDSGNLIWSDLFIYMVVCVSPSGWRCR